MLKNQMMEEAKGAAEAEEVNPELAILGDMTAPAKYDASHSAQLPCALSTQRTH